MKRFTLLLTAVLTAFSTNLLAAESLLASCDFTKKSAGNSNYTNSWTYDGWTVYGAANNNGGWTYAKFGGKQENLAQANPCYIFGQVESYAVTKIVVTTNEGNLSKSGSVNEWGVNVYSDADKSTLIANVKGGTMTTSTAEELVLLPGEDSWAAASYYEVYFDMTNTTSDNGIVWIDKIDFYGEIIDVPATAIALSESTLALDQYKTATLTATLTPANATTTIVWTSSEETVATVENGVVTAVGAGNATITASAGEGISATCEVTVTAVERNDWQTVHTSAEGILTTAGGTSTTKVTVNTYDAIKAGTGSVAGKVAITVPANTTKLYLHAAGWNGENVSLSIAGATADPASLTLTADSSIKGSASSFTLAGDINADEYFFEVGLSGITTETTLTLTATGGKRFVIWGVNYELSGPTTTAESAVVAGKVVKMIEDGQLVIVREGVKYNAQGVRLQ